MKSNLDELKIDEAIETYPLEVLPEGFVARVLEKIEARPAIDPRDIWDANTRFIFSVVPVVILWLGMTAALLVRFGSAWVDPVRASYYHSLIAYWKLQLSYSAGSLMQFGLVVMVLLVVGGFAALWQLTDPAREMKA